MASFNKVILVGNLTRDPQVRYIPSGTAVTDIDLAVNRTWFDKQSNQRREETTFINNITIWGRQAEVAGEYLAKGRSVLIEGRLQLDQWEDKNSGEKRSRLKVVGENMRMLGGRGDGGAGAGAGGAGSGRASQARDSAPRQEPPGREQSPAESFYDSPPAEIPEDDVPF